MVVAAVETSGVSPDENENRLPAMTVPPAGEVNGDCRTAVDASPFAFHDDLFDNYVQHKGHDAGILSINVYSTSKLYTFLT